MPYKEPDKTYAGVSIYKIAVRLGDDVRVVKKHNAKLVPGDSETEKAFT